MTSVGYSAQWGGYTDRSYPEADHVMMDYRFYSSQFAKFLTQDPIGYAGGYNLYAYCDGDPVNRIDPDGLESTWVLMRAQFEEERERDERVRAAIQRLKHSMENGNFDVPSPAGVVRRVVVSGGRSTFKKWMLSKSRSKAVIGSMRGGVRGGAGKSAINLAGEGEIPGVVNFNGPRLLRPGWQSQTHLGKSLRELQKMGHKFIVGENTRLPFRSGSIHTVYTNNVRVVGSGSKPSWLGPLPQTSEIKRVLGPGGKWIHNLRVRVPKK